MVKSSNSSPTEDLRGAIDYALDAGVDVGTIAEMVAERISLATPQSTPNNHAAVEPETDGQELRVFTKVPDGLIDLPTASDKYGRSRQVISNWVRSGWLGERGLVRQPGSAIAHILVAEDDLVACTTKKHTRHKPNQVPMYDELPKGLIDLPTAGKKYGLNTGTVRGWVNKGELEVAGRLRAPAPGGGYLVVSEDELLTHIAEPRNKGRPKKIRATRSD